MPRRPGLSKKEKHAKKNKRRQMIIGGILTALMILSVAAIFTSSGSLATNEYNYNEYTFKLETLTELGGQQAFVTDVEGEEVYFYTLPQDSFRVSTQGNLTQALQQSEFIFISSDPASEYAQAYDLIAYDMSRFSGRPLVTATPVLREAYPQIPVFTCENATASQTTTIFLNLTDNQTNIDIIDSCIYVNFMQQDITYIRDRLLYSTLGIVNR